MKKLIPLCFLAFLISCSTQNVAVDFDRQQDFSKFSTYALRFEGDNWKDLEKNRMQTALVELLQEKSLHFEPQSAVVFQLTTEEFITEQPSAQVGFGVGTSGRRMGTSMGVGIPINRQKLQKDYLIVMRNEQGELVWEGKMTVEQAYNAGPEVSAKNMDQGLRKLFKNFPPPRK